MAMADTLGLLVAPASQQPEYAAKQSWRRARGRLDTEYFQRSGIVELPSPFNRFYFREISRFLLIAGAFRVMNGDVRR